jgi:hypothetical protein
MQGDDSSAKTELTSDRSKGNLQARGCRALVSIEETRSQAHGEQTLGQGASPGAPIPKAAHENQSAEGGDEKESEKILQRHPAPFEARFLRAQRNR